MPVTAGLLMASAALLIRTTSTEVGTAAITAAVAFLFSRLHPSPVLGAAPA